MSLDRLDIFEKSVSPSQLLRDLGIEPVRLGDSIMTECPSCRQKMWVLSTGFLCTNKSCLWRAGSIVDMTRRLAEKDYPHAIDKLWTMYGSRLPALKPYNAREMVQEVGLSAFHKRELFDFFQRLQHKYTQSSERAAAESWLLKSGIDIKKIGSSVFIASSANMLALKKIYNQLGFDAYIPSGESILYPYFGDHHTVAEITFYDRQNLKKPPQSAHAFPFRFSLFGLNDCVPTQPVILCRRHTFAAVYMTNSSRYTNERSYCALWHNPEHHNIGYLHQDLSYLYRPEEAVDVVSALSKHKDPVRISTLNEADLPGEVFRTWDQFVVDEAKSLLIKNDKLDRDARYFLDAAVMTNSEHGRLDLALRRMGKIHLAKAVADYFSAAPVYRHDTISLYATPGGYYVSRKNEPRTLVANFTLTLKHSVKFPDDETLFHEGSMLFNGEDHPFMMDRRYLDLPKELEAMVLRAEGLTASVRDPSQMTSAALPLITDKGHFKHVTAMLQAMTADLPSKEGINRLGWNQRRDAFFGPYGRIMSRGQFHATPKLKHHPSVDVLRSYLEEMSPLTPTGGEISVGLQRLIAQASAMVARSFLNMPIQPVLIEAGPTSKRILLRLFAGLGQKEIVPLVFNARVGDEMRYNRGFPMVAFGYTQGQSDRSTLPMFLLLENGAKLRGNFNDDELDTAAYYLREAVYRTAAWLVVSEGAEYPRISSVSNSVELLSEGTWLVRNICGFDTWDNNVTTYPQIEKLLRAIPVEKVSEYFAHHLARKVYLDITHLPDGVDLVFLELELRQHTKLFEKEEGRFAMDAFSGMDILNNFYHQKAVPRPIEESEPGSPTETIPFSIGGS